MVGSKCICNVLFPWRSIFSGVIGKEAAALSDAGNATVQLLFEGAVGVLAAAIVILKKGARALTPDARATVALMASGALFAVGILLITTALASDRGWHLHRRPCRPTPSSSWSLAVRSANVPPFAAHGHRRRRSRPCSDGCDQYKHSRPSGCLFGLITAILFAAGNFLMKYTSLRVTGSPCIDHISVGCHGIGEVSILLCGDRH